MQPTAADPTKNGPKEGIPVLYQVGLVGLCSMTISSTGLIMRAAEHNDAIAFSPSAVTFFSEMLKFAAAVVLSMFGGKEARGSGAAGWLSNFRRISRFSAGLFLIPALLYVFANNLRFYITQRINPGLLQVLWNVKIAFVGILYALPPFRRPLTLQQWAGAAMLVLGSTIAELSQGEARASDGGLNTGGTVGLLLLVTGLAVTSVGAISCEYAYKHTAHELDFPTQCCLLYGYGTILNLLVFSLEHLLFNSRNDEGVAGSGTRSFPMSLTEGFDAWAWAVVVSISITGFLVGMIFKYIDTVAQVFSDMSAMFVTSGVAWLVFGLNVNAAFLLALAICTISLLVYYSVICRVKGGGASPGVSVRAEERETHEMSLADDEEDGKGITLQPLLLGAADIQQEQAEQFEGALADGDGYVRINSPLSAQNRKGNSIGIGDDALDVDDEGQGGEFEREL